MIRVLHFADFHLGMENYGRLDIETGLSSRVRDFLVILDHIVDVAVQEGVDAVVFAGDAYRNRDPSLTYQREFSRRIGRMASRGIAVILLVGNHDLPNAIGRATPLDIYETLAVERVHVFAEPATRTISTNGGPLQIVALPWVRRDRFISSESLGTTTADQLDLELNDVITTWIAEQAKALDPVIPAIMVAHATIHGARYGSERKVLLGRDLVLTSAAVDLPAFAYVALGHIHKPQVLGAVTPIVYSGSTERIDFGEEKEDKTFVLVDVEAGHSALPRFQPITTRKFLTVSATLGEDDPTQTVLDAIGRQNIRGTIVRVVVEGSQEKLKAINRGDIVSAVREAHFFAGLQQRVTSDDRRPRLAEFGEGLTPQEALRHYFESRKITGERYRKLMSVAEQMIAAQNG